MSAMMLLEQTHYTSGHDTGRVNKYEHYMVKKQSRQTDFRAIQ